MTLFENERVSIKSTLEQVAGVPFATLSTEYRTRVFYQETTSSVLFLTPSEAVRKRFEILRGGDLKVAIKEALDGADKIDSSAEARLVREFIRDSFADCTTCLFGSADKFDSWSRSRDLKLDGGKVVIKDNIKEALKAQKSVLDGKLDYKVDETIGELIKQIKIASQLQVEYHEEVKKFLAEYTDIEINDASLSNDLPRKYEEWKVNIMWRKGTPHGKFKFLSSFGRKLIEINDKWKDTPPDLADLDTLIKEFKPDSNDDDRSDLITFLRKFTDLGAGLLPTETSQGILERYNSWRKGNPIFQSGRFTLPPKS